jgi:hypothetical protein
MSVLALCKYWQKLMRLLDWDIEFSALPKKDYAEVEAAWGWEPGSTNGHMDGDYFKHSAFVTVSKSSANIEYTIAHELSHVMHQEVREFVEGLIANIKNPELCDYIGAQWSEIHERSIHATSRALLNVGKNYDRR